MSCERMRLLVQADHDGELDAAAAAEVAAHVEGCAACAALQAELAGLSALLRELTREAAPDSVRRLLASGARAGLPSPVAAFRARDRRRLWGAAVGGMALAAAVLLAVLPPRTESFDPLIASHIRALQPGHLIDVASSDQHTVKPWFDGRTEISPPVRNLAADGFPLIGGRLDYAEGRTMAVLVYRRDKHDIDVFVWPSPHDAPPPPATRNGYNVVAWSDDGLALRAVSDLNLPELQGFVRLFRSTK